MAPKANAYLIKAITTVSKKDGDNQIIEVADYSPKASLEAMHHIIEVIKDRQLQGKAVVSHSLGIMVAWKIYASNPLTFEQGGITGLLE